MAVSISRASESAFIIDDCIISWREVDLNHSNSSGLLANKLAVFQHGWLALLIEPARLRC